MGPAVVGCGGGVPLGLIRVAVAAVAVAAAVGVGVGRGGMEAVSGVVIGTAVVGPRGMRVLAVLPIVDMTSGRWRVC
jgi:hypothetical protein